jgi:hypothetical protein
LAIRIAPAAAEKRIALVIGNGKYVAMDSPRPLFQEHSILAVDLGDPVVMASKAAWLGQIWLVDADDALQASQMCRVIDFEQRGVA